MLLTNIFNISYKIIKKSKGIINTTFRKVTTSGEDTADKKHTHFQRTDNALSLNPGGGGCGV